MIHYVGEASVHYDRDDTGRLRCRAEQAVMCIEFGCEPEIVDVFDVTWGGDLISATEGALEDVGLLAQAYAERLGGVTLQ